MTDAPTRRANDSSTSSMRAATCCLGASSSAARAAARPELHGPYLQWSYTLQNKRFTRWFTPEQEERYRPRIKAARRLRELVTELERLEILSAERAEGWGT
jgi:hypothetical protein